jgi:peroxiredoxin
VTPRHYTRLACGLGVCLVVAQIAIKPNPVEGVPRTNADVARRNREWHSRLAPVFELTLRDGSTFRLADHAGRQVIILNFFTTWCEECPGELADLQRYARILQLEHKPIVVVAVDGQEPPALVDQFSSGLDLSLPIGIDSPGTVMRAYEVSRFPTTVVIGAEGRVQLYRTQEIPNPEVAFDAIVEREFDAISRSKPM